MALDLSAPKAPPARQQSTKSTPKPGIKVDPIQLNQGRYKTCIETLEGAAGLFAVFGWHADAGLIMMQGTHISQVAVEFGDEHEKVGDAIDILGKNSIWTKLIGVGLVFGAQLGVNHGWIKHPEKLAGAGVVTPETLIALSKSKLAEIELQAMQQQRDTEIKLAKAREEAQKLQNGTMVNGSVG